LKDPSRPVCGEPLEFFQPSRPAGEDEDDLPSEAEDDELLVVRMFDAPPAGFPAKAVAGAPSTTAVESTRAGAMKREANMEVVLG
jgi:hypothetical protein